MAEPPLLSDEALTLPDSGVTPEPGLIREEWTVASYGNPGQIIPVRLKPKEKEEGPTRLAVEMFGGASYSTAITLDGDWRLSVAKDAETVLLIYNATPAAMQGGWAYTLSAGYIWYESKPFVLKPGWNTIRIRQGADDFKTKSSDWKHTAALWRPQECHAITLLLHNGRRTGRLFIDRISVTEAPAGAAPGRGVLQPPK